MPVFGVGEEGGLHYYAMQYIQRLGLDEVLDELRRLRREKGPPGPRPPAEELRASRGDVSAEGVARSLLSGVFERPHGVTRDEAPGDGTSLRTFTGPGRPPRGFPESLGPNRELTKLPHLAVIGLGALRVSE